MDLTKELNQVGNVVPAVVCCACTACTCSPCMCIEDDCCQPGMFIPEYDVLVEL